MNELQIKYLPVDSLTPYAQNAKRHPDEQVEHIANSIRQFGFKQPIVVDRDNVVVIGHGRLLAAKKLGMETVPCIMADDLTEEQIRALRLADNKTNESAWDFEVLDIELEAIDIDMSEFGFELQSNDDDEQREQKIKLHNDNCQIIIDCIDESDAQDKYNKITEMGIECRISTL